MKVSKNEHLIVILLCIFGHFASTLKEKFFYQKMRLSKLYKNAWNSF